MAADPRFELAYHGHNHGTPGETTEGFVQEFQGFESHEPRSLRRGAVSRRFAGDWHQAARRQVRRLGL